MPVTFAYRTTEGRVFSSTSTRGHATFLAFVTTYDLASQVQLRELDKVVRRAGVPPKAIAVVVEEADYAVLAEAMRTSLGLSFPVALSGNVGDARDGPFGKIEGVPTVVLLDRVGLEVWRKRGLASPRELDEALAAASGRGFASGR